MTRDTGSLFQNLATRTETYRFFVEDGFVLEVCVLSPVQGGWRKKPDDENLEYQNEGNCVSVRRN